MDELAPVHPGEVLVEELIAPLGVTQPRSRSRSAYHSRSTRSCTASGGSAPTRALRLARYSGTTDLFRTNLRNRYDLEIERDKLGPGLDSIEPLQPA
ncbi:addiction module antidote protein, HigA family [Pseudonocardia nantongensis]|uniref:addiction module antidote protein, HigA family n=1 Tax=Pseudonocardia nantongensis TaxID=1181885 RepID=UPI003978DA03